MFHVKHERMKRLIAQCRSQFRHGFKQVGHQAVVGNIENRRFRIFVDGHNHLAVLHTGGVLDGAGNADGDLQLRRHHFAGLAYLVIIGRIIRVYRRA